MFVWIAAHVAQVADLILGGGGGTLIGSGTAFASYTYLGTVGTVWVSTHRLLPGVSAFSIRAVVSGALILTDGAVEDWAKTGDETSIPVDKLGNAPAGTGDNPITRPEPATPAAATFNRIYGSGGGEDDQERISYKRAIARATVRITPAELTPPGSTRRIVLGGSRQFASLTGAQGIGVSVPHSTRDLDVEITRGQV